MTALDWLAGFCHRQSLPLVLSFLVVFPFLIHYISATLFYRRVNSRTSGKRPPTIPYWIPGIFHSVGLISSPAAYFAGLIKEYGNYAPFAVKAGTQSYLVVRRPDHIQKILQASDQLTTNSHDVDIYDKVMGAPKGSIASYKALATGNEDSAQIHYVHRTVPLKHLTGSTLIPLVDVYISIFRRNMSKKMFQLGTWTQIEDLWSFFEIDITRATVETLFGSALLKQYPKVIQDFWKFDANAGNFLQGMPRFTISSASDARDRLLGGLKKWLQTTHGGTDFAKIDDDCPIWDESRGSKFIQERDNVFAKMPSFNYQARAAEILSVMQSMNSAIMPSVFWHIVEVARNPTLLKYLKAETAPYFNPKLGSYNIAAITNLPVVESIHAEIGRLRTSSYIILTNDTGNFGLDEEWKIPKGTHTVFFSHDLGLNTELWAKARSQTVARPLEEFWAERFLIPDKSISSKKIEKDRKRIVSGTFSLDGLDGLHVAFDRGQYLGPTCSFAQAIQAATLAVLLTEFEIRLCDLEATEQVLPPLRELAYGTVKPLGKVAVNIRKRKPSEKSS